MAILADENDHARNMASEKGTKLASNVRHNAAFDL
jgi:hypothetical protein